MTRATPRPLCVKQDPLDRKPIYVRVSRELELGGNHTQPRKLRVSILKHGTTANLDLEPMPPKVVAVLDDQ